MGAPFSKTKQSRGFEAHRQPADRIEAQDMSEARENKTGLAAVSDKVAQLLGDPVYITQYTWTALFVKDPAGHMRQLYVSQYFPNRNVAVDKFYDESEIWEWAVDAKRKALKALDVKYVVLRPSTKLSDVAAELA